MSIKTCLVSLCYFCLFVVVVAVVVVDLTSRVTLNHPCFPLSCSFISFWYFLIHQLMLNVRFVPPFFCHNMLFYYKIVIFSNKYSGKPNANITKGWKDTFDFEKY